MLNAYLSRTNQLLQNPSAPTSLYATADLTSYINQARGQVAGEGECVRYLATSTTTSATANYNFSALNTGTATVTGVQGAIHIRSIMRTSGSGLIWLKPRPWEWFQLYHLNAATPAAGTPDTWSQFGQGSANTGTGSGATGSFYLDPVPNATFTLTCDCVCYPQPLAADGDIEALPYLWTDAVPYYAAYLALLSAQNNTRMEIAERMFSYYTRFVQRARKATTPSVNRYLYEQSSDIPLPNMDPVGGSGAK